MENIFLLGGKTSNELKALLKEPFQHQYRENIIQNAAAIIIQSWWKKLLAGKYYNDVALQISELALWDGDIFDDLGLISAQSEPLLHLIQDEKLRSKSDDKINYSFSTELKCIETTSILPQNEPVTIIVNPGLPSMDDPDFSVLPKSQTNPKRKSKTVKGSLPKSVIRVKPNALISHQMFPIPTANQIDKCKLILKAFQKYKDKKLFQQLRSSIMLLKSDKNAILRYADYNEIQLIKTLPNTYLRFRLDGLSFPPNILYKICSFNVVDVNSFAPRNYSKDSAWYLRSDRNGWRSVDYETISKKLKYSHLRCHRETNKNKKFNGTREKWQIMFDEDFSNYEMNWVVEAIMTE